MGRGGPSGSSGAGRVLGGEAWIDSLGFTIVADIPGDPPFGMGFFAMMNILDFDVRPSNRFGPGFDRGCIQNQQSRYRTVSEGSLLCIDFWGDLS